VTLTGSLILAPTCLPPILLLRLRERDYKDDDFDMYVNFENEDDVQLSSESTKKRRPEDGDASSSSHSTI